METKLLFLCHFISLENLLYPLCVYAFLQLGGNFLILSSLLLVTSQPPLPFFFLHSIAFPVVMASTFSFTSMSGIVFYIFNRPVQ